LEHLFPLYQGFHQQFHNVQALGLQAEASHFLELFFPGHFPISYTSPHVPLNPGAKKDRKGMASKEMVLLLPNSMLKVMFSTLMENMQNCLLVHSFKN
jgi:hypothetical protein